jgi:hypothetical protein
VAGGAVAGAVDWTGGVGATGVGAGVVTGVLVVLDVDAVVAAGRSVTGAVAGSVAAARDDDSSSPPPQAVTTVARLMTRRTTRVRRLALIHESF